MGPAYTGHVLSLLHQTGYGATTPNGDKNEYKQTGGWVTNTSKECYVKEDKQFSTASHYHDAIECVQLPTPPPPGRWTPFPGLLACTTDSYSPLP